MGRTGSIGMAEAVNTGEVNMGVALAWHLRANHYPPLPHECVPVAAKAISRWDAGAAATEEMELPENLTHGPTHRRFVTVGEVIEDMHLEDFLAQNVVDNGFPH